MLPFEAVQPFLQRRRRLRISVADFFDAASNLAKRQYADIKVFGWLKIEPRPDLAGGSAPFSQFAQDIGVQQKAAHNLTSRGASSWRAKSSSTPTSGMASRDSLKESGLPLS